MFIDQNYAWHFKIKELENPIEAFNVDGTKNKKETIKSYVDLAFWIGHKRFKTHFYVTGLGKQKIILGFSFKHRQKGYQYYVKWKGYLITKATWESESAFSDDVDMLQQYKDTINFETGKKFH